jgi:hypothetical protein
MKMATATAEARMIATEATALVTIALVGLAMPTSSPATLLPMPLPMLSPSPLHLPACFEEGSGKGGKSDGNSDGDEEGNGDGGKSN